MSQAFNINIAGFKGSYPAVLEAVDAAKKADAEYAETLNTIANTTNMVVIENASKAVASCNEDLVAIYGGIEEIISDSVNRVKQIEEATGGAR